MVPAEDHQLGPELPGSRSRPGRATSTGTPTARRWVWLAEKVTGQVVQAPTAGRSSSSLRGLGRTSFPSSPPLPRPFIHGYVIGDTGPQDVSTLLSPSGAWASGAIVSTPRDLNTLHRAAPVARLFPAKLQLCAAALRARWRVQPTGARGERRRAGRVALQHESAARSTATRGTFPATCSPPPRRGVGGRAVTTSLNIPAPTGALLARLRAMQQTAVGGLLRDLALRARRLPAGLEHQLELDAVRVRKEHP